MAAPLVEYLLRLGDDRLVLGHRLSEWTGHGPILEEDIAMANIALDLIGQASQFLKLAGEVEGMGRTDDALAYFREQLASPGGSRWREYLLEDRGLTAQTIDELQIGWAPPTRDALRQRLLKAGFKPVQLVTSGLVTRRDDGTELDRFRNRLMIPIRNEHGDVIAFTGRQLRDDPRSGKYINSPETSVFKKSHVLFALELDRRLSAAGDPRLSVLAHPGFTATNLQTGSATGISKAVAGLVSRLFAQPVDQGVLSQLHAATGPDVRSGQFFGPGGAGLHSTSEYVNIDDVYACRDVLAETVTALMQAASAPISR